MVRFAVYQVFVMWAAFHIYNNWLHFTITFNNELATCLEGIDLEMHMSVQTWCYARVKSTQHETCAKMHWFHIVLFVKMPSVFSP